MHFFSCFEFICLLLPLFSLFHSSSQCGCTNPHCIILFLSVILFAFILNTYIFLPSTTAIFNYIIYKKYYGTCDLIHFDHIHFLHSFSLFHIKRLNYGVQYKDFVIYKPLIHWHYTMCYRNK